MGCSTALSAVAGDNASRHVPDDLPPSALRDVDSSDDLAIRSLWRRTPGRTVRPREGYVEQPPIETLSCRQPTRAFSRSLCRLLPLPSPEGGKSVWRRAVDLPLSRHRSVAYRIVSYLSPVSSLRVPSCGGGV